MFKVKDFLETSDEYSLRGSGLCADFPLHPFVGAFRQYFRIEGLRFRLNQ